jgi:hypothetical protein
MANNNNGYIGVGGEHKPISKRYVGIGANWKEQDFKFIGENGYWRLIYTKNPIDMSAPFYVRYLDGYSLELENSLTLTGANFRDYQLVSPKVGVYFEIIKNASDLFGNFANGTYVGTPQIGALLGDKKCMGIETSLDYFQLPSDLDAIGVFGATGTKDYTLSQHFYIPTLPIGTDVIPLLSYGNRTNGMEIVVSSDGRLQQKIWNNDVLYLIQTPINLVTTGWNSYVVTKVSGLTKIYLGGDLIHKVSSTQGLPNPPASTFIRIGSSYKYSSISSGLEYYSVAGTGHRYVYQTSTVLSSENIDKLLNRANPVVVLKNKESLIETIVPEEWMLTVDDDKIIVTIPNTVYFGEYELFIRYFSGLESFRFPISISPVNVQDTPFIDNFDSKYTLINNYYILDKAWGGANGGVIPENVFIRDGELILRGHGDRYTGSIQGRGGDGLPKFHTQVGDPQLGLPWTNRVGGCIVFNKRTGFGSYELDTYIPNNLGCAYALWTFFYNEIYPSDPRYNDFLLEGLHQQGSAEEGYYLTRNHEIDIEFPSHLDGGTLSNPSLSNFKANTWRGELQNWDVPVTDPTYWEEYRANLTPVGFNIADGNYHKLRYDWYPDRVEFYIDGQLKRININTDKGDTIPDIPGFFTFGVWFPSSPLPAKPWLVNPVNAWGGGVVDPDGGMKADFDEVEMRVRTFKFTPFNEFIPLERRVGETYPFGGYNKK